jgi:hypothetical protein
MSISVGGTTATVPQPQVAIGTVAGEAALGVDLGAFLIGKMGFLIGKWVFLMGF